MTTTKRIQIHVVMYEVEVNEAGEVVNADVLEEEELAGYKDEWNKDDEQIARRIFSVVTGVNVER